MLLQKEGGIFKEIFGKNKRVPPSMFKPFWGAHCYIYSALKASVLAELWTLLFSMGYLFPLFARKSVLVTTDLSLDPKSNPPIFPFLHSKAYENVTFKLWYYKYMCDTYMYAADQWEEYLFMATTSESSLLPELLITDFSSPFLFFLFSS